jgi:hypothetical protein
MLNHCLAHRLACRVFVCPQSRIVYTPFLIPQEPRTGEAFFCNESVSWGLGV